MFTEQETEGSPFLSSLQELIACNVIPVRLLETPDALEEFMCNNSNIVVDGLEADYFEDPKQGLYLECLQTAEPVYENYEGGLLGLELNATEMIGYKYNGVTEKPYGTRMITPDNATNFYTANYTQPIVAFYTENNNIYPVYQLDRRLLQEECKLPAIALRVNI